MGLAVVIWEPSNEFWCFSRYQNTPDGEALSARRLAKVGRLIETLDDRPIHFEGDADLGGIWNTFSMHYPQRGRSTAPDESYWLPNLAYFRDLSGPPLQPGQALGVSLRSDTHLRPVFGEKPVLLGEIGLYSFTIPTYATQIVGDRAYGESLSTGGGPRLSLPLPLFLYIPFPDDTAASSASVVSGFGDSTSHSAASPPSSPALAFSPGGTRGISTLRL